MFIKNCPKTNFFTQVGLLNWYGLDSQVIADNFISFNFLFGKILQTNDSFKTLPIAKYVRLLFACKMHINKKGNSSDLRYLMTMHILTLKQPIAIIVFFLDKWKHFFAAKGFMK